MGQRPGHGPLPGGTATVGGGQAGTGLRRRLGRGGNCRGPRRALEVVACDLDPLALAACRANAALNGVELGYSEDFFAESDRFDLILVADVLYDRENLPLLDQFLSRGREALVADSRVRDFRHPLYRRLEMLEAFTLPDLAEPEEFRHVSLYHAQRDRASGHPAQAL